MDILVYIVIAGVFACIGVYIGSIMQLRVDRKAYQYLYMTAKDSMESLHQLINSQKEKVEKIVIAYIKEAEAITNSQLSLWKQLDGPNKGAAHSKWRSSLVQQLKQLEEDKINIFQKMVDLGYDLPIAAMDENGKVNKIKMSEAIKQHLKEPIPPKPSNLKPVSSSPVNNDKKHLKIVKSAPKLKVIKKEPQK